MRLKPGQLVFDFGKPELKLNRIAISQMRILAEESDSKLLRDESPMRTEGK